MFKIVLSDHYTNKKPYKTISYWLAPQNFEVCIEEFQHDIHLVPAQREEDITLHHRICESL